MKNKTTNTRFAQVLLYAIFYAVGSFGIAHADTVVSGTISNGTVWNKTGSPYLISDQVEVPAGATLSIEPGTVIKLGNGAASIESVGTINAIGTEAEPITFTSWYDDSIGGDTDSGAVDGGNHPVVPSFGDWNGINFQGGAGKFSYINFRYSFLTAGFTSMEIDHAHFQYAELSLAESSNISICDSLFEDQHGIGIEFRSGITAVLDHVSVNRSNRTGISVDGSIIKLSNSNITNTKNGELWSAIQLNANASVTMEHTVLDSGTTGIKIIGHNILHVTESTIKNFKDIGVYQTIGPVLVLAHPSLASSVMLAAATIPEPDISITRTEISNNGTGIWLLESTKSLVEQNSIHDNQFGADGISFENNWWGDASGPHDQIGNPGGLGDEVSDIVQYKPWLTSNPLLTVPPVQTCCSSVAFLPGLEASRLYDGTGSKLWEPFTNADVRKLDMDANGNSIDLSIYAGTILDQFKAFGIGGPTIYKSFMQEMDGMVSDGTITSWKAFPYDWRQSVNDIIQNGVKQQNGTMDMAHEIETLAAQSKTGKVTIIAHSNGGLVAKALMMKFEAEGKANLVDKIIFVAVPQIGTPDTLNALLHGISLPPGGVIMDKVTSRGLAENMPGAYGLIPTSEYFQKVTDPIITFDQTTEKIGKFIANYGANITSKSTLDDFLAGVEGRKKPSAQNTNPPNVLNKMLITQANQLHQLLDEWQPPTGIDLIQLAGIGKDTIKGIKYTGKYPCTKVLIVGACAPYLDETPIYTSNGDKTVISPSALAMQEPSWYVDLASISDIERKNYDHKNILEAQPVLLFLKNTIMQKNENGEYITSSKPVTLRNEIKVSMHSPASIDLYDAAGNHTGVLPYQPTTDIVQYEENIPNSYYMEFGEGKYAGFGSDSGNRIAIQGTGAGTFTLTIDHTTGDTVTMSETFADIPVTPSTKAEVTTDTSGASTLVLDVDGNGTKDFMIQPTGNNPEDSIDPVQFLQIMKQTVHTLGLPPLIEKGIELRIDLAIKFAKKDKQKKLVMYLKQFSRMVEEKHWKRMKKLSTTQRDALIEMIGKLLDTMK